jgi:histidine triad (HIT) family protein
MSSVFSKIIKKEIPAYIVAENENNIAFMDIFPIQKGHVLVVPKIEIDNIFDLPVESYLSLFSFSREVSIAIKKVIPCNRIGLSVIGLEVPHAHIHLVPINSLDDMNFNKKEKIKDIEIASLSKKISANFK